MPADGHLITCEVDLDAAAMAKGVILVDNVLWSGEVLLQPPPDRSTAVIQELNRLVASDPRATAVLVTIRDGVLVVRSRSDHVEKP